MVADIGYIALVLGLFVSIYTAIASFVSQRRHYQKLAASARNGIYVTFGLVSLAVAALLYALVTHDFRVEYVASYTSRDMSLPYLFSALWAGNSGSLLLWGWLVSLFSVAVVVWKRVSTKELIPYASSVVMVTIAFFLLLLIFVVNPFNKLSSIPLDGNGLNPLLQNPGMIIHPPTLLAGFAGLTIPFAFAIAALVTNRKDRDWLADLRRWVLISWIFLSIGNVLGAWWAYVELGWGGYWAWDPVENSSLIPWLVATALLHSIIVQRTKGRQKLWTMVLIIAAFNLPILATFLTRTGVLSSVHAFPDTGMGPLFLGFMGLTVIGSSILVYSRRHLLQSDQASDPLLSKEGSLQVSNIIFIVATAIVLVGTLFPLLIEVFGGEKANLQPHFFNITVGPVFLVTILLMGICTLIGWKRTNLLTLLRGFALPLVVTSILGLTLAFATSTASWAVFSFSLCAFLVCAVLVEVYRSIMTRSKVRGENPLKAFGGSLWSNKPRYGAMIVHLGIAVIAIGVIGSSALQVEKEVSLTPGQSATINQYTITYTGIQTRSTSSMDIVAATMSIENGGEFIGEMVPEKLFHRSFEQPVTEVAIRSTLREDLYIALAGWDADGTAAFQIMVKPAVKWIWIGGGFLLCGGLIALWTQKKLTLRTEPV